MIELYTHKQVAEYLGVDEATVYRWRKQGVLSCRKHGRWVRYTEQDIEDFLQATGRKAEGQRPKRFGKVA